MAILPKGFYINRETIYFAKMIDGKRHTFSTGLSASDPKITIPMLEKKRDEFIVQAHGAMTEETTKKGLRVRELYDDYLTYLRKREDEKGVGQGVDKGERRNSYNVGNFFKGSLAFFGQMKPESVAGNLEAYKEKRQKDGVSAATINGEFRNLAAAMKLGWTNNKVALKDLPKKYPFNHYDEKAQGRTRTIPDEDFTKLYATLAPHLKPYIFTLRHAGLRPVEARRLLKDDVILDGNAPRILAVNRKNGAKKAPRPKVVAIIDELLPVLKAWKELSEREHPEAEFFFHQDGKRIGDPKTAWYAAQRRAGIADDQTYMMYDCRRSAATAMGGISTELRKKQMGHTTEAMDARYNQDDTAHVRAIQAAMRTKTAPKVTEPTATAPAASQGDWKAELKELKAMMDDGILTDEEFATEKARVLANR